ncbi:MAG TPA: Rrf2 family transcriptional regulator [Candidatus Binatus sp.]|nr:Rrf2 family transcriptional regulator [Candidatus Binatus sp.]
MGDDARSLATHGPRARRRAAWPPTARPHRRGRALRARSFVDARRRAALHSIPTKSLGIEDRPLSTAPVTASPASDLPAELPIAPVGHARPAFHGSGAVAFSTKGEYGVRLMVQLGRHYGAGPASLTEIAGAEDMPRAYLEQLAFVLRDAGLVTSTRGAHGGYALARPPAEIPMSEVLQALEGPLAPMICATDAVDHDLVCDRTSTCTVNFLWLRVRDAIAGALDTMTLADLVPPRRIGTAPRAPLRPQGATTAS